LVLIMLLCSMLNLLFVMIIVSLVTDIPFLSIWRTNHKWEIANIIALIPLGLLISLVYNDTGIFGVILFLIPLLVARRSFQLYMDMRQAYVETIESLAATIDAKDRYTRGHSERVARYTVALARQMGLLEDQIDVLRSLALLHDTGKIGVSEDILNKPGRLDDEEFTVMQRHPQIGADIIKGIKVLKEGYETILHHHERWDGKGYPEGLSGKDIPLGARIIAVADSFDAMTSDRPYRPAMSPEKAFEEITAAAGTQFDPAVVAAFKTVYSKIELSTNKMPEEKNARAQPQADDEEDDLSFELEGDVSDVR